MDDDLVFGSAAKELQKYMQSTKALVDALRPPDISFGRPMPPIHSANPAEWTYTRIAKYIQEFESKLDNDHEIGARLVSFGQSVVFHIDDIGYHGPDIITFHGFDDTGQAVQLIQNIAQLSVLLMAMKKVGAEPKRIGFKLLSVDPEDANVDDKE